MSQDTEKKSNDFTSEETKSILDLLKHEDIQKMIDEVKKNNT